MINDVAYTGWVRKISQSKNNLMMELEHGGVRDHAGVQEPPDQLVQERELVLDAWRSHQLTDL